MRSKVVLGLKDVGSCPLTIPNPRMVGNELPGPHRAIFPHKVIFPRPEYGLPENFVWLMVFCGRERIRTERIKDILRNKSNGKCISFSKEVITAIYSVEAYVNLAIIFIIIINN